MNRNLTRQVIIITLMSVFISAAAILLTASYTVSSELTRQQHRQTERIINYLAETIARGMPGSSVSKTERGALRLVVPPLSGFNDSNVIDQSVSIGGDAATVFSFDTKADNFERHLTSIKTEKGERATGSMLASDSPAQAFIRRGETYYGPTTLFGKHYYAIYQPTFDTSNHVNGILFAGSPMEELYDAGYHNIMWNLGLVSLAIAALLGLAVSSLVNRMFNPLRALARRVDGLTKGDLTSAIPAIDRGDEIGSLAKAIEEFQASVRLTQDLRDSEEKTRQLAEKERESREATARAELESSSTAVNLLGAGLNQLARGNLVHEIKTPLYPAAERLRSDLNQASRKLRDAMTGVASAAHIIRNGTIEIAATADDISRRTEQQAASLEETATALADITKTVAGTASRVREANEVVAAAKANAEDGGRVVTEAIAAMNQISSSAHQISSIISVIDEIAFQTNLLALNAGVEAARAGEAGRGFAVVASEVRALAQRSAEAAKEIKALISTSAQQVDSGVGLVDKSGQVLTRILDEVAQINELVAQIARSAQEQETSLQQVNIAVRDMNQVTHQNATMVEQSTVNIHALAQQAEELESLMQQFQITRGMKDDRHSPKPQGMDAAA